MKKHNKNDSGIALLFTLILVVMFFVLGMAFMSRANFSAKMSRNFQESEESRLGANVALENIRSSMVETFSKHHIDEIGDQGYSFPVWEVRRKDEDGVLFPIIYSGSYKNYDDQNFAFEHIFSDSERGLRSLRGTNGEIQGWKSSVKYNVFGDVENVNNAVFNTLVIDPAWEASITDPRRKAFSFAYVIFDKAGLLDINATKQATGLAGGTYDVGISFADMIADQDAATAGVIESYANYDLSKIWTSCIHKPEEKPLYNFDDLYGTAGKDAGPSTLLKKAEHVNFDGGRHNPWNYLGLATSTNLSYRHLTSPYSVAETFPAYDDANSKYTGTIGQDLSLATPRFNLKDIENGSISTVAGLLGKLPYLDNWGNGVAGAGTDEIPGDTREDELVLQKNTVAANILDYCDNDLSPTTNYVFGATGSVTEDLNNFDTTPTTHHTLNEDIYHGNERVPYINEIVIETYNYSHAGWKPTYTCRAEIVFLYDQPHTLIKDQDMHIEITFQYNQQMHEWAAPNASLESNSHVEKTVILKFENNGGTLVTGPGYFSSEWLDWSYPWPDRIISDKAGEVKDYTISIKKAKLYMGATLTGSGATTALTGGTIVDVISTGASEIRPAADVARMSWECIDPRNNTYPSGWVSRPWGNGDSLNLVNNVINTGKAYPISSRAPNYPFADLEMQRRSANGAYVDSSTNINDVDPVNGPKYWSVIDPVKISTRYMPLQGPGVSGPGIQHPVELGLISRALPYQTINLTEYNLDTANLGNAQFSATNNDNTRDTAYYDPVANGMCNGGDRELLDQVYIPKNSIYDEQTEKKVYGKYNLNSMTVSAAKVLLASMLYPNSDADNESPIGTESFAVPKLEDRGQKKSLALNLIDQLYDNFTVGCPTAFTYDKRQPTSVKNSPNDPMRWGSKRLGSFFARDDAYLTKEWHIQTSLHLTDRMKETLLFKTKDYVSFRYTQYSGVIVADSLLCSRDNGTDFDQITRALETSKGDPIDRPALYAKSLSQRAYQIELAYDHFLDKVIVLDYKYTGKLD